MVDRPQDPESEPERSERVTFAVDRDADSAAETVALIVAEGGDAAAFTADVRSANDCAAAVNALIAIRTGSDPRSVDTATASGRMMFGVAWSC